MDYRQFTDAIMKGASQGAPASSIPELGQSMMGAFRAAAGAGAGKAQGNSAAQQASDEEERRKAAYAASQQKVKDMLDPAKYEKQRKDDGGFAFFDPSGKEIDIDTYAKRTGLRRVDAISDSENPVDLQFIDDYKNMNGVNQAVWNNDSDTLNEYKKAYPDMFAGGKSPTIEDLNKRLLDKYPHMFGRGNYQVSQSNLGKPLFRMSGSTVGSTPATGGKTSGWAPN